MPFTIDNEAFNSLPESSRTLLRVRFADPNFILFIKAQIKAQQFQIAEFDPEGKTPEAFYQTAKELRLILQFWNSFLDFAEDWGTT